VTEPDDLYISGPMSMTIALVLLVFLQE